MAARRLVAWWLVAASAVAVAPAIAVAQVRYAPVAPAYAAPSYGAPTPYGYPVPFGFLQPNETLGTSSTFLIQPYARPGVPAVRVIQRCQYPDGWNVTDFDRDVNGVPAGVGHTCPGAPTYGLHEGYRSTDF